MNKTAQQKMDITLEEMQLVVHHQCSKLCKTPKCYTLSNVQQRQSTRLASKLSHILQH